MAFAKKIIALLFSTFLADGYRGSAALSTDRRIDLGDLKFDIQDGREIDQYAMYYLFSDGLKQPRWLVHFGLDDTIQCFVIDCPGQVVVISPAGKISFHCDIYFKEIPGLPLMWIHAVKGVELETFERYSSDHTISSKKDL